MTEENKELQKEEAKQTLKVLPGEKKENFLEQKRGLKWKKKRLQQYQWKVTN